MNRGGKPKTGRRVLLWIAAPRLALAFCQAAKHDRFVGPDGGAYLSGKWLNGALAVCRAGDEPACSPPFSTSVLLFGAVARKHTRQVLLAENTPTPSVTRQNMSALLRHLLRWLCPHRFSWPHSGIHGQDYQVCLRCGTAFEYDTTAMRRTGKVVLPTGAMSRQ